MGANSVWARLRAAVLGRPRDLNDRLLFHKLSLVAVLAWVGLGADGLSSSCYGPEETYKALGAHPALAVFVALACVGTIAVLCASYRQIIELFPTGGGGYFVATKLLGRGAGVVSGSALLVDYVLTIAISIAGGADALFSLLPPAYLGWKLPFALTGVAGMTLLNLRGVRESVLVQAPIFFVFVATHAVAILVAVGLHAADLPAVTARTAEDVRAAHVELGTLGVLVLLLKAFSVGAGTYTGIEAVSNGLPVLREPQAETGKRTMLYMGLSLGVTVFGLLLAYLLVRVQPAEGKTLNAVLFETITAGWPGRLGQAFVLVSLVSATALLFIAAQAGYVDGPRVLANMALDRWFPTRFAQLSDRFVAQNGLLLMGGAAAVTLLATGGSVGLLVVLLVVLYSINVFLTFTLSQLGMCVHWVKQKRKGERWARGLVTKGVGLCLTGSILV
ncbi:MAG TPA: APC family permease, partial [Gemmataceae bacterium]|nr:APC family permease [Gemmataceae bacterium]